MSGDWAVGAYSGRFSPDTKQNLRELYSGCCAICRRKHVSPYGNPEAEAAHIQPVQHGGLDRETNGLLLCRHCHWGFDSGWLSLEDDYTIIVSNQKSAHGYEHFQQFDGERLLAPSVDDLKPEPRFMQVHRKLFGFDSIVSGDVLTVGGLHDCETQLVDGRNLIVEGGAEDALVVNCRVVSVDEEHIRCTHQTTLKRRPETDPEPTESPFDTTPEDFSLEQLEKDVREIRSSYTGVEQKWEWGRLFRIARTKYGLSHYEIAAEIDVDGASELQVQRAERVYDMFPAKEYMNDGPSYSAIAELQRVFPQPDDARLAYDCIVATVTELQVWETRVWVELLMEDADMTRINIREAITRKENIRKDGLGDSVQRILNVQTEYESLSG